MKRIERTLHIIDVVNEWVGRIFGFLILPITATVVIEVVLRYVFQRPTIWAWEVNVKLMAVMALLAGGYAFVHGRHVKVDLLTSRLSGRARAAIDVITGMFFFFAYGVLIYQSAVGAWESVLIRETESSLLSSPVYPIKCLIPIGASLLVLQGLAKFLRDLDVLSHFDDKE